MLIRQLTATDAEGFRAIRLEGLHRHPEAFGAAFGEEARLSPADFAARLADTLVLGGFDAAGTMQGVIGLARDPAAKSRHIATIWGMYVRPPARGTGLAARLLDAAMAAAFRGCRSIRLSVAATNQPAQRLYRRAGFTAWATDREALLIDGRFHDEILMRRDHPSLASAPAPSPAPSLLCCPNTPAAPRNPLTPELSVSDWRASLRFYRDILGFTVDYQRPEEGFAFLRLGEARLMIDQIGLGRDFDGGHLPDAHPFGRGVNLQIEVADAAALAGALRAQGIPLLLPIEDRWYRKGDQETGNRQFVVADPDGYLLRFFEDLGLRPLK